MTYCADSESIKSLGTFTNVAYECLSGTPLISQVPPLWWIRSAGLKDRRQYCYMIHTL